MEVRVLVAGGWTRKGEMNIADSFGCWCDGCAADDPIFRASTNSKSSSDILSEAYDKVVKRNTGL